MAATITESSPLKAGLETQPPRFGWIRRRLPALVLLLAAGVGLTLAAGLDAGQLSRPGPGLWPMAVAVILLVVSALLLLTGNNSGQESWERRSISVLVAVLGLAGFLLLFPVMGFTLPAVLLTFVWLRFLGHEKWTSAVVLAVAAPVLLFLLFNELLGVALPYDLLMSIFTGG